MGIPGPAGLAGPTGPVGPQGPVGPGSVLAVEYDDAGRATIALDGTAGTQVKNLADGTAATDVVNKGQMDAGDAATLASANAAATLTASKTYTDTKINGAVSTANAYTDSKIAAWNDNFSQYQQTVDARFAHTDARIDRIGAMGGEMSAAAINTDGLPGTYCVGIGVGMQGGKSAVAIGYQRLLRPNVSVSLSGAFSGGDNSVSAGAGFSW